MAEPILDDFRHLLAHYRSSRRDLPWRADRDPYRVLVSEVMLQQTQVDRVVAYFERFLLRFPSLASLARAQIDEVLAAWSGLGYYSRARRLHQAAREVHELGGFPRHEQELRRLPGVGEYTAAALASIAFGQPTVALDTNALRVLARYLGEPRDPARAPVRRGLRQVVLEHLPEPDTGDLTQAFMELGATVCRPTAPECDGCPLRRGCTARASGTAESIPPARGGRAPVEVIWGVARIEDRRRFLLLRQSGPLLRGLWTCPLVELATAADAPTALGRRLAELGAYRLGERIGEVRHSITFRRIRCQVYAGRAEHGMVAEGFPESRWVGREGDPSLGLPSLTSKILQL